MSLIDGPTNINKKLAPPEKSLSEMVPRSLALRAIRQMEKLTGISLDPAPTYFFTVEISGLIVGLFTQCSGIGARREVETIKEGGLNDKQYKVPGQISYEHIVLQRGLTISRVLLDWFLTGMYDYKVKRLNISITQGSAGLNPAAMAIDFFGSGYGVLKRWNIERAFPVSWKISDLNVDDTNSVVVEKLEIAHEGLSLSLLAGIPLM